MYSRVQLKAAIHMGMELPDMVVEDLGSQVLASGQLLTTQDIDSAIDKITVADVQAVGNNMWHIIFIIFYGLINGQ